MKPQPELAVLVGKNIERLRKDRGWSQLELAEAASCHRITVSRVEQGHRLPDAAVLFALADALEVPTDELRHPAEIFSQ